MKKRIWFLAALGILVVALAAPTAFGAITGNDQTQAQQATQITQDTQATQDTQVTVTPQVPETKQAPQTPEAQQTPQSPQNQQFFNQMFEWHQNWLDQAQKDGQVTPEQAGAWQEHFNYMRDFHNQNGMGSMMGGMMGSGRGMMGNFNGGGFGGMMGGFNNQSQSN